MKKYILKKKGLYYGNKNISKEACICLQEQIEIDKNVTLRDIFQLLKLNEKFFSILFFKHYCMEYIKAGLKIKESCKTEYFDYIKIRPLINIEYSEDNSFAEGFYNWDVIGIKNKEKFAIDLSHLSKIIDVPIKIEQGNFEDNNKSEYSSKNITAYITLYELINSILYEISFHGLPDKKLQTLNEINHLVKKYTNNKTKTDLIKI